MKLIKSKIFCPSFGGSPKYIVIIIFKSLYYMSYDSHTILFIHEIKLFQELSDLLDMVNLLEPLDRYWIRGCLWVNKGRWNFRANCSYQEHISHWGNWLS